MALVDNVFIEMCENILSNGVSSVGENVRPKWEDGSPAHTIKTFGVVNRYDLRIEFPALTLRPLAFKSCVEELLWIWSKKSNNVNDLGPRIWDAWADDTGSIGTAYGYQLGKLHKYREGMFDQVDRVLFDLKNDPFSRRIMTNMFVHEDLHSMGLYPCAYSLTFNVTKASDGNMVLNAILNQRSQDILAASAWNVAQYAVLVHMFAQSSGMVAGELVHVVADAHIYDRHVPAVRELVSRCPLPAAELWIDPTITNFYEFSVDSFKLIGYQAHEQVKNIPIAV